MFNPALHARTPSLAAVDARGLPLLSVTYCRQDPARAPEVRIERRAYDAKSHLHAQWDARLWADGFDSGSPNQAMVHGLSRCLQTLSADSGWRIELFDAAGHPCERWDGRGTHWRTAYDIQLRPVSVHEQRHGIPTRCLERFSYGGAGECMSNRCGRTIRHDDPAGSRDFVAYGLFGNALVATQRFHADLTTPDWPESLAARDALLETDAQGAAVIYATCWRYDGAGRAWEHVDVSGHARRTYVDVAGQTVRTDFQPSGTVTIPVVHDIAYDAVGHTIAETAGNGVVTSATWSAVDGRLRQRQVARQDHLLQDVDYLYDPLGNVTQIEDRAQPTTWFDGAVVDPRSTYTYDTLYQLIEATGRESVHATIGPALPGLILPGGGDASRRRHYTQTFVYDAGGNLLALGHAAGDQTRYTQTMAVAPRSNRSLLRTADAPPPDFGEGFDANGNQQGLGSGTALFWDARNQLQWVKQVVRVDAANDEEGYVYSSGGIRQRKVRTTQSDSVVHVREVRYLPGLELHRNSATGETWEVASMPAGRGTVRWLRWQSNGRKALPSAQWRFSVDDHLGSGTLELDEDAAIVSHEGYYPFGGTAWWAARNEVEASTKTIRYSGKERDSSGLYYYGYRYYAPWLSRWISPDPAGDIDGLNRYRMVSSNPITRIDVDGRVGTDSTLIDALDLATSFKSFESRMREIQGIWARNLRSDPRDLAPLDPDRIVTPVYRPGTGAFAGWERFSAITNQIIAEATANKHEKQGPRKAELNKLTAHAGYFVHASKELHAGFVNLPAPLGKKNTFEGVELLGGISFRATTTDALVDSVGRAYDNAGAEYAKHKVISSSREREAPNPLHSDIRFTLRGHIERTTRLNKSMNTRNGVPGMHAEVQAYNHAKNAGLLPGDFTIFTQKLDKNIVDPTDFVACYNCTALIPQSIPVLTERSEGWPTQWHRLGERHRQAAGFSSRRALP